MEAQDAVLYFICVKASLEKMIHWSSNAESAFISTGFSNWKDATVKFANHASSKCHEEAVLKTITLPSTCTNNRAESLSAQAAKDRLDQRQCFLKVLSNIMFLAQQGQAPFLTIMIDETTDVSNKEQVVICFRWADQSLKTHEDFIGLCQVESTGLEMLIAVIHNVLHRLNISVSKLRGQCYECPDHGEEWLLGFSRKSLGL